MSESECTCSDYEEPMGDTDEEKEDEIHLDIRQARHFLKEVKWDKMEDWQWDMLYRYVPSPSSESDSDTIQIRKTVENLFTKSEAVDEDNPIVEYKEGDQIDKYPDVFSMYMMLKMDCFQPKVQAHPPKMFATFEDSEESEAEEEESEEEYKKSSSEEQEEEEEKDKKPAKQRRKIKKKKKREERRKQKETSPKPEEAIEENKFDYLKRENVFLKEEDIKKIDSLYEANLMRLNSNSELEAASSLPPECSAEEDKASIKVAPSLRDLIKYKLKKLNRNYFLHRIMYLFKYKIKDKNEDTSLEAPMVLKGYVAEQNTSYSDKYFISGCLFFYKGYSIVMVEGGEYEIMNHFLEMRGSQMLGEFISGKVMDVHSHRVKRYFDNFVTCTAERTGPVEKIKKTDINQIVKSFGQKMTSLYRKMPKLDLEPGKVVVLDDSLAKTLPSVDQIRFMLGYKVLRRLPAFVNSFIEIPNVSDSSDEAWPPQELEVPLNILDPDPKEIPDLEKEMWEKIRRLKRKKNKIIKQSHTLNKNALEKFMKKTKIKRRTKKQKEVKFEVKNEKSKKKKENSDWTTDCSAAES